MHRPPSTLLSLPPSITQFISLPPSLPPLFHFLHIFFSLSLPPSLSSLHLPLSNYHHPPTQLSPSNFSLYLSIFLPLPSFSLPPSLSFFPLYLHLSPSNSLFLPTFFVHIYGSCAYTKVKFLHNLCICTYFSYVHIFPICVTSVYAHMFYVCTTSVYVHIFCICSYLLHI